jgi:hypothetical protein
LDTQDLPDGEEAKDRPAISDWDRYGLARQARSGSGQQPSNRPAIRRGTESRDDMYLEYRRENLSRGRSGGTHGARFRANVLAAAAVAVAAVIVIGAAYVTGGPKPTPTPPPTVAPTSAPRPTATPSEPVTPSAQDQPGSDVSVARPTELVNLPSNIVAPDRAYSPDDGTIIYLTGPGGGVALDPRTSAVEATFAGPAFETGLPRAVVAGASLWVSSSPYPASTPCDRSCWDQSTTYQLDVGTGKAKKELPKTYLVGASAAGIWIATAGKVEQLDPFTGDVVATTPWKGVGEPRVGCDGLWSVAVGSSETVVSRVDQGSGLVLDNLVTLPEITYGPFVAGSECWMMSGTDGVSADANLLVQISGDVITQPIYSSRIVILLDGAFWGYLPGGLLQQYDPAADRGSGPLYALMAGGADDPSHIFASLGSIWTIDAVDGQLIGYGIPTRGVASGG